VHLVANRDRLESKCLPEICRKTRWDDGLQATAAFQPIAGEHQF
jgi:hypothetical protein